MNEGRRLRRGSIQRRVLLLALVFTLLAAAVIAAGSARVMAARLESTAFRSAEYALETASSAVRSGIDEVDSLAAWCSADPSIRTWLLEGGSQSRKQNVYITLTGKYNSMRAAPYLQHFVLFSADGSYMSFGTYSSQIAVNLGSEEVRSSLPGFGAEEAWRQIVSDPLVLASRAPDSIPVVRALTNAGGHRGRVCIGVSPSLITDALRTISLTDGGRLYWKMGGVLYAVEEGTLTQAEPLADLEAYAMRSDETLSPDTELFKTERDGQALYVVSRPVGVHDLYLVETMPRPVYAGMIGALLKPAAASLLVIFLLGVVLALMLHRQVALPVVALRRRIERISAGDFTVDPDIEWNNELGDIGRGLNQVSRSITALMDKRIEDEKQKQDMEYRMLQNQINPHFIYNALNSIKWMAAIQHAPGIEEMVTALSRLLKSVSKGNERLVPLYEEFALLNDYFTIEQYRYGGTITLDVDYIEDEALARECLIPRFTLQPLVENAIFHGIEPKGRAGEIRLTVTRERESGDVLLRLHDDGVGMTAEQAEKALSEPSPEEAAAKFRHVGMWNVHRRLQYIFGEAYGLSIDSTPGAGTTVTVRLPGREGEARG